MKTKNETANETVNETANQTVNQTKKDSEAHYLKPVASTSNTIGASIFQVAQSLAKGSAMGAMEVAIDHPLWTIKTRLQSEAVKKLNFYDKWRYALKRKGLYKGVGVNMASMVPITAVQVGTAMAASKMMQADKSKDLVNDRFAKQLHEVTSAFLGGAAAASVATPAELVMMRMSETVGARAAFTSIWYNYGKLSFYTGYSCTAIRDGFFTVGFLAAPRIVENAISSKFGKDSTATIAAGPIAGVIAALGSHPFDTIKTKQQEMLGKRKMSALSATKQIITQDGFFALYNGCVPRAARVVSAITIMNVVGKYVEKLLQANKR